MSLHSQLLRGLFAMPLMLLLAIAGLIAPEATPATATLPPVSADANAGAHAVAHAHAVAPRLPPRECPRQCARVRRVQVAIR